MVATSSNNSEILTMHEASQECVWLRSMIQHIRKSCGLSSIKNKPTVLYEDNVACIAQVKGGYIKGDRTKRISPKFFYPHELHNSSEINMHQIRSNDILANLFTKVLPTTTFKKLVHQIGMRQAKDLQNEVLYHYQMEELLKMLVYCTLFLLVQVLSHLILLTRFLMKQY